MTDFMEQFGYDPDEDYPEDDVYDCENETIQYEYDCDCGNHIVYTRVTGFKWSDDGECPYCGYEPHNSHKTQEEKDLINQKQNEIREQQNICGACGTRNKPGYIMCTRCQRDLE